MAAAALPSRLTGGVTARAIALEEACTHESAVKSATRPASRRFLFFGSRPSVLRRRAVHVCMFDLISRAAFFRGWGLGKGREGSSRIERYSWIERRSRGGIAIAEPITMPIAKDYVSFSPGSVFSTPVSPPADLADAPFHSGNRDFILLGNETTAGLT